MGKTAAERQRESRQRRKDAGLHETMKMKDRERKQRKKQNMNRRELKTLQEQNRLAQRRFKQKQKQLKEQESVSTPSTTSNVNSVPSSSSTSPYKSRQSLGKALRRVKQNLPQSPRKIKKGGTMSQFTIWLTIAF